jgi:folate-binding protein YgfZ
MNERSFLVLTVRGVLSVGGADRRPFLQGLISNDVDKVSPARAIYAGFLTAQGRYLHDFLVAEIGERLVLDGEAARLDDLRRRLMLYRLRSKVDLAPAPELAVVALFGPGALSALELPPSTGAARPLSRGVVFVDPRVVALGARALVPREDAAAITSGFTEASPEEYDRLRLSLGVPDGSRDLPIEKALVLENGFDEFNGIDWRKGCYVGQEVTARMKYRALVRRRLLPVRITGQTPEPGTPVMLGDVEAGEMRTASDGMGLALLRIDAVDEAHRAGAAMTAGRASVVPLT